MKRIVSVLLCAVMIITAVPCMAFAEVKASPSVNWKDFRITSQPEDVKLKYGETFTFSVEVSVPEGIEITGYQWFYGVDGEFIPCEGCNSPTLTGKEGDVYYPEEDVLGNERRVFFCVISAAEKDAEGNIISTKALNTYKVSAITERTFIGSVSHVTISPWFEAFSATVLGVGMSFGALLPVAPLLYVGLVVVSFIDCIKEVI